MPETTPLIKAALNLRGGAGFDVYGRKNWLFSDSVEGAEASAIAYTMVEMAKAHNLNIYQYLSYVLEQRPNENWSDEQLAKLAPWSEKLQTLKM